jgi:inosine-uridine nucleoside N-ribohydrolase
MAQVAGAEPVPVVLDTDIGDDIDDTWALAYLLRSPELELRMVLTDYGDTVYRAKVAAKLLEVAGRGDVPVGIGIRQAEEGGRQSAWVEGYDLGSYPGAVHEDGVQALIELIRESEQPIRVIAIGPAPNIRAALERAPDIAERAAFFGMYGSVRKGYGGNPEPEPEWNVRADPASVRAILAAPWAVTLTPLDTCGLVRLAGEDYAAVRDSDDPLARAVIENYRIWLPHVDWLPEDPGRPDRESTVLFDTVAVYMAFAEELLEFEDLTLRVTDEGHTIEDPEGRPARCALRWVDRGRFERHVAARVAGESGGD